MEWSTIQGRWHEVAGLLKKEFGKLTHDDVTMSEGNRERLVGKLEQRYGYSHNQAEQALSHFVNQHYTGLEQGPIAQEQQRIER